MNLPKLGFINEYIRIPKVFYNFVANSPFEKCLFCNKYLLSRLGEEYATIISPKDMCDCNSIVGKGKRKNDNSNYISETNKDKVGHRTKSTGI